MAADRTCSNNHGALNKKHVGRRTVLKLAAGAAVGTSLAGATGTAVADAEGEVRFEDQESDGTSLVLDYATADVEAFVIINEEEGAFGDVVGDPSTRLNLSPGDEFSDVELTPDEGVLDEGTHELTAVLWESNGSVIDSDTAMVEVEDPPEITEGFDVTRFDADPGAGFEYPYFLFAPDYLDSEPDPPILVEPNNTGTATDDFDEHLERARSTAENNALANQINAPILVPAFPRPREEPVDLTHYIHALDDTTMGIDGGKLERVDLQLLNMVEHAQDYLADQNYPVSRDGILLNGFSASGNFVDRFTVLHPEEVISVTAGGLNGMPILPLEKYENKELPYHVGIADVEDLTGEEVDLDALSDTNQFLYMGREDDNDTIPFNDAWTDDDLRQLALDVYGDDMIDERFPNSQQAYKEAGVEAQFRIYPGAGHSPREAFDDIVEFHRRSIRGEDVSELGDDLEAAETHIGVSTTDATVGEEIEFDGSESQGVRGADIVTYQWDFGTGVEATGETTTQAFEEAGTFEVTLTIVTELGNEHETMIEIEIAEDPDEEDTGESETDDTDSGDEDTGENETDDTDSGDEDTGETETDDEDDGTTDGGDDGFGPGFGVGGALASVGGVAYLLKRRINSNQPRSQ